MGNDDLVAVAQRFFLLALPLLVLLAVIKFLTGDNAWAAFLRSVSIFPYVRIDVFHIFTSFDPG
tara:strand:- start:3558 stop:3749 length:192 start_codon:yes stop_codon:yes gene_type:complete